LFSGYKYLQFQNADYCYIFVEMKIKAAGGSYLQLGIGSTFGGLPEGLRGANRKDLVIFTEMFSDQLMEIIKQGFAKKASTGFAEGSEELYKWLDQNPKVKFLKTEHINDPARIAKMNNFNAVNTAIQVDLYGSVNATMGPNGKRISSPGGQVEFMSGASRSFGGKAIIALPSTKGGGEISSITLHLYPGPITTPRESVTHVVTEYGIATLQGKSERDRAISLIKIAHPKFRTQLADEAYQQGLLRETDLSLFQDSTRNSGE
jgi:4-hydroxybutyrate CoA-transferase